MSMTDTTESARMSYQDRMANFYKWMKGNLNTLRSVLEFIKRVMDKVSKFDTGKDMDIRFLTWMEHELDSLHDDMEKVDTPIEFNDDLIRALRHFKVEIDPDLRDLDSTLKLCKCIRWSLRYFMLMSFHVNSLFSTFDMMNVPELKLINTTKDLEMRLLKGMLDPEMKTVDSVFSIICSIMKVYESMEMGPKKTNTDPENKKLMCDSVSRKKRLTFTDLFTSRKPKTTIAESRNSRYETELTNTDPEPERRNFKPMFNLCENLQRTLRDFKSVINLEMRNLNTIFILKMSKIDSTIKPCGYKKWNLRDDNIPKELDDILQHDISEFYTFMTLTGKGDINNVFWNNDKTNPPRNNDDGVTPLQKTCNNGTLDLEIWFYQTSNIRDVKDVKCELDKTCDIKLGNQPLHVASENGQLDVVKGLLKANYTVDEPNYMFWTPIHCACRGGHLEIVKCLCDQGCDKEACTDIGQRPLHVACIYGYLEIVKYLCDQGCDKKASTNIGQRPLDLACTYGHLKIVQYLCEQGCNMSASKLDSYERTDSSNQKCIIEIPAQFEYLPIIMAAGSGNIEIVRYLSQQWCDKNDNVKMAKAEHPVAVNATFSDKEIWREQLIKKISRIKMEGGDYCYIFSLVKDTRYSEESSDIVEKVNDTDLNCTFCKKSIYLHGIADLQKTKDIEYCINAKFQKLYHERIVQYFGALSIDREIFIFMEFVEGKSLDKHINKKPLPHKKVIQYSKEILEGLKFLHQNRIIHRDIRPPNIMLNAEEHVKICGFGLSCYLETIGLMNTFDNCDSIGELTICETLNYKAPELFIGQNYSYPVDIWALGASVVEMLTGKRPFHGLRLFEVILQISTKEKIEFIPAEPMSENMKSFVDQMLCPCPSTRATAEQLLKFIDDVHMD